MIIPFYPITQQFIESFCAMDIAKINLILDIDRKFCKVYKLEFVASLSRIFNYLKLLGENSFDCYSAKCISDTCCNCNKNVIVFSSKKSKNYLTLMIEGDNEQIYQISECYNYDFNSSKLNDRILIGEFVEQNWEGKQHNLSEECIKELYPIEDYIPSFEELSFWLEKTTRNKNSFRKKINPVIQYLKNFYLTIEPLYSIKGDITSGLENYTKLDLQDEASVIFWVAEYEEVINKFGMFFIDYELDPSNNFICSITNDGKHLFDLSDYSEFPDFETKYYNLYNPLFKKFDIEKHYFRFQSTPLIGRLKELNILVESSDFTNSRIDYEVNHENLRKFNDNYLINE
jgi:hypothetical protein